VGYGLRLSRFHTLWQRLQHGQPISALALHSALRVIRWPYLQTRATAKKAPHGFGQIQALAGCFNQAFIHTKRRPLWRRVTLVSARLFA
jgi:hypothetical protein